MTKNTSSLVSRILANAIAAGLLLHPASGGTLRPVDLTSSYNARRQTFCCNSADYPGGLATYLGVPFNLGPYNAPNTVVLDGAGVVTVTIPVQRQGVQRAFTLLNTAWGQPGPTSYLRVEFESDLGEVASFDLIGNVHLRDHAQTSYTCCLLPSAEPTHTQVAWSSGAVRADMQTFVLPPAFADRTLTEIRFIDSGGTGIQRGLLFALSTEDNFCYADLNGDHLVDDTDFIIFLSAYNMLDCADPSMPLDCPSDFNRDTVVDDSDFGIFVVAYNELVCP
ncbi:MAG: hypothetical protein J0L78_02105 [Planctomycetes bacterium]|nr:hypothetical protein [Planctomycetota bacterium]